MVQRTVSVGLVANVNNYVAGMDKARVATEKTAAAAVGSAKSLAAHADVMNKVGTAAMGAGALAAAGLALVIKATADYGSKMAQLQSLSHASAAEMKQLSDAAMTVGTAYGFSASQVADAEIEMTKAGVSVTAQLGGALKGALALAAAGQLDVGTATEYATVAMTQFGLSAKDVPHLADLMSAGADKALGSVGDLGEALKNGGLQAHNMGLTIDDTVGLLSAFANAGIIGAEAGTQMRSMFIQLQRPSAQAQEVLDKYGISLSDASGKFVGITKLGEELRAKLGDLTQAQRNTALATVFGSHAITGATVLYQDSGKAAEKAGLSIGDWIKAVNDTGFANAQAAGKMNSLTGDVQKLAAAFQTDLIKAGGSADGMFRGLVQGTTNVVKVFGDLDPKAQGLAVTATAVTAGVGLLGGAFLIAVPKVLAFKTAMTEAGISGRGLLGTFGKGTAIIAGLAAVTAGLAGAGNRGMASAQDINLALASMRKSFHGLDAEFKANSVIGPSGGLKAALDASFGHGGWNESSAAHWIKSASGGIIDLAGTYEANEGKFDALGQQLAGLAKQNYGTAASSFAGLVRQYKLSGDEQKSLLASMPAYREALIALAGKAHVAATDQNLVNIAQGKGAAASRVAAAAAAEAAASADKQATELGKLTGSGNDATQSMKSLHDALAGLGSTELDARAAARAFRQAIDDATKAARTNGHTLDINTQAGRDNQQALDAVASSARDSAAAYVANGGSAKGAAALIANGRSAYIKAAESMGMSKSAANRLADALHLIPKDVNTAVSITGGGAVADALGTIQTKVKALDGSTATIYVNTQGAALTADQLSANRFATGRGYADGGAIGGRGPKGVDSVPAVLAPGEHVLTAGDVDKMGGQSGVYAFRAALHMATGGAVGDAEHAVAAYKRAVSKAQSTWAHASKARKSDAKTRLDDAKQHLADAQSRLTTLRQGREDFVSTQRRATPGSPIDPLSYVDQLRAMSRDSNYSAGRRSSYYAAANKYEASLVKLSTKADAAATKLADLKSASDQMRTSIASSIAGGFQASGVPLTGAHDASTSTVASGWITRNGIRMQNYRTVDVAADPGKVTAGGLASYYSGGAQSTAAFASQLKALASRKVNPALIAEIAGYGVEQGSPIAAAILSASPTELATINSGYKAIQSNANIAGTTVANDNYAALITSQEKTTGDLQKQIATDGEKLRKLIASAFGLKGYASGTSHATPGLHLVGERGPELLAFRGGERVYTAGQTAAYIRGTNARPSVSAPVRFEVSLPTSMNLIDAGGQIISTVRVEAAKVAKQVYSTETTAGAVHLLGSTR